MINLNLITTTAKKNLLKETVISLFKDVLLLALYVLLVNSIFIFISRQILDKNFQEIKQQKEAIQIQNQPFNQEVAEINQKLISLSQIQTDFIKWSEKLSQLTQLIPDGIKLSYVNFDKNKNLFKMAGSAALRDNFLELKHNLETSEIVFELESPLSNLLKQEDLEFSLAGKLKSEE